jgi:hypothetical protein
VRAGGATLTIHPPDQDAGSELILSYFLDYGPTSPIARQLCTCPLTPGAFIAELAGSRTFLLQSEAAELLQVFLMGRGYGVSPQAAFERLP